MRRVPRKANDSMSKLRPLFALAVVATALAVAPGMASAATQPMTVTCSETCTANGAHWVPVDVNVIFAWPEEDTDAVATVSPECQDGAFQTITAEGDQTLHCDVTYVNGDTSSGVARVMIDKTPPVASGAATTSLQPNAAGWFSAPFQIKRVWTDSLSGVNADNCDLSPDYSGSPDRRARHRHASDGVLRQGRQPRGRVGPPGEVRQRRPRRRGRHPGPWARLWRLVHAPGLIRLPRHGSPARLGPRELRQRDLLRTGQRQRQRDRRLRGRRRQPLQLDRQPSLRRHEAHRHRRDRRSGAGSQRLVHARRRFHASRAPTPRPASTPATASATPDPTAPPPA